MKRLLKLPVIFFLFPLQLLAQPGVSADKDITGLWKGTVITPELNLPYELVINRQNGKLSGYSHTTFTVRGEEIVSVKKVIIRFKKDEIIIEDEDMLFNNFKEEAPKKIKQTNTVSLEESGKVWRLYGTFEARAPRMLKPVAGTIELEKKESAADTKLIAKLGDLNLASTISFSFNSPDQTKAMVAVELTDKKILPEKTTAPPTIADYDKRLTVPEASTGIVKTTPVQALGAPTDPPTAVIVTIENTALLQPPPVVVNVSQRPTLVTQGPVITKKSGAVPTATNYNAKIAAPERPVSEVPEKKTLVVPEKTLAKATVPAPAYANKSATAVINQPVPGKPVADKKPPAAPPKSTATAVAKSPTVIKPTPINIIVAPALDLAKRQIQTIEQLYIESDSLQFTLYDNGEVDGDTVSVALNGKTIVSRQGLNTSPFTKTVYMTPDLGDSIQLIMYAENLGTLAPNTGLLVLQYDNKRQEIRFSGDLNKNAAITLRRREKR